jgi:hypothetical protein
LLDGEGAMEKKSDEASVRSDNSMCINCPFFGKIESVTNGIVRGWVAQNDKVKTSLDPMIAVNGRIVGKADCDPATPLKDENGYRRIEFRFDARGITPTELLHEIICFQLRVLGDSPSVLDSMKILTKTFFEPIELTNECPTHLDGCIDGLNNGMIQGWAWDSSRPDRRLSVCVFVNKLFCGRYVASRYRPDLLEASKGDGRYAFNIDVSAFLAKMGGAHPKVQVITESPEAWSIRFPRKSFVTRTLQFLRLHERRNKAPGSTETFVRMLVDTHAFPKRFYGLHKIVGKKISDPFSADYTLLAIEFMRQEAVEASELMRKGGSFWLRGWFRLLLIEFQTKRLCNLANAIIASQKLLSNADGLVKRSLPEGHSEIQVRRE